jgi:hypothetical protein
MQANRGDFHCLGDAAVRRYDPRLMEHIEGYTESHPWSTKSVEKKNIYKIQISASNYGTNQAPVVCENFIPQNGPSTQLIHGTSCVEM